MGSGDISSSAQARVPAARAAGGATTDVASLARRFELQRRAATEEFAAGVDLAAGGAVRLLDIRDLVVTARVDSGSAVDVELRAVDGRLEGRCTCRSAARPCRHAVAVAHALWVQDWQLPPYGETSGRSGRRR